MASHRKLGKATDLRMALLKNQVSQLLWNGKLETTEARAKEVQSLAEKYITLAVNTYKDKRLLRLLTTVQISLPQDARLWLTWLTFKKRVCPRKRRRNTLCVPKPYVIRLLKKCSMSMLPSSTELPKKRDSAAVIPQYTR